jgi:uncharacterized protein YjcR
MKSEDQSHAKLYPFLKSPRCGAKTRKGTPCQAPAMANGRCRMHGGKAGAPLGNSNALKHGYYTRDAIERRQYLRELIQESRKTIESLS